MSKPSFHENLHRDAPAALPADRKFGLTMGAVFSLLAAVSWWHAGHFKTSTWILAILGASFLLAGQYAPAKLHRLNIGWAKLGLALHHVVNPIIMLLLYSVAIMPMGIALKLMGKDPLRRKKDPQCQSYWIERTETPGGETMKYQF